MELRTYLGIIYKRLWIVVLLPVVVSLAAAYYNFYNVDPYYMSDTTLYIGRKASLAANYSDLMMGTTLLADYRRILKSRNVTSAVIEEMKLGGMTPEALAGKISVASDGESRIITISVYDGDPRRAKDIAEKVAGVFILKIVEIMKLDNVSVIDKAMIPKGPVTSYPARNVAVSFLIGVVAAIGIAFLLEYINDKIKTQEDVEKYLGVTVLGTIPEFSIK